jgi:phosphate transport system permease protein
MWLLLVVTALLLLSAVGFYMGRGRAVAAARSAGVGLHSLPGHYGHYVAIWCGLPGFAVLLLWLAAEPRIVDALMVAALPPDMAALPEQRLALLVNDIKNLAAGRLGPRAPDPALQDAAQHYLGLKRVGFAALAVAALGAALAGLASGWRRIHPAFRARLHVERAIRVALAASSLIAVLVTIGIVLSLLFEAIRFFRLVPVSDFLFGLHWSPQTAIRADQMASEGSFGAIPLFTGTLLITVIAMAVATPVGLMSAIYMSDYASPRTRAAVKPTLEILAGIPTVVYGFFAAVTLAPFVRDLGSRIGLDVASESALAAGLVMGIMIVPFISSLSDDVINAVPQSLRDGSYALGATKSETIRRVVVPAALPGIIGAMLLGMSRAVGETMIVVMAAGLAANLTANPFEAVTTVTVQIVTLLVGDQEFDSAKTLAAFALGLVLLVATLLLNVIALRVVQKYREKYD